MTDILIIEDNEDNMELVFALLEDQYTLRGCVDGFETIELFEKEPDYIPHLILCDISLPEMDGIELIRVIRNYNPWSHIPIIAITSHAMKGDRERFLAAGFDDYIAKPIMDERMLCDPIDRLLKR